MTNMHHLLILLLCSFSSSITVPHIQENLNLQSCVNQILTFHFHKKIITYISFHYDRQDVVKVIHKLPANFISRNNSKQLITFNVEYIIEAETSNDFCKYFPILMKEPRRNPYALFLIIVNTLETDELRNIFDTLLVSHVKNVVLINGSNQELFTYNPFDNYNCGKNYVIEYGKCVNTTVRNLYPIKLVTGLRNCTFKATIANWPPYAIDQKTSNKTEIGVEQYVFQIISELEGFKVTYTDSINGEDFSTVGDNITSGNLLQLLAKQTDFIFGGMLLVDFRAEAFNFICGHLPYKDNIRVFVRKAGPVTGWKNLVLEFDFTVWLVLLIMFFIYFVLLVAVTRVKHKSSLFLVMLDLIFLHGNNMVFNYRSIFIFWVIYAYLINTYYQSSLVSITSHPVQNYQISKRQDLHDYNLEDCTSIVFQKYLIATGSLYPSQMTYRKGCIYLMESMRSVSTKNNKFTLSLYSLYLYNKYLFYDEHGEDPFYAFKDPMNAVIYAIYFHKGFPLQERMNIHAIRLRENGLIDRFLNLIYYKREKHFVKTVVPHANHSFHLIFPWYVLLIGAIASIGVFLMEVVFKKLS